MTKEKRKFGFVKKLAAALIAFAIVFAALPFLPASMEVDAATTITSIVMATDSSKPAAGSKPFMPAVYSINGDEDLVSLIDLENSYAGWYYDNGGDELAAYEGSTFKAGYIYDLYVELAAVSGAKFSENCAVILVTPDGMFTGYIYGLYDSNSAIGFDYFFNLKSNIKKVTSVNFKTTSVDPKTGAAVFTPALNSVNGSTSSKTLVSDVECQWGYRIIDTEAEYENYTSDTFDAGNEYMLACVIGATETSAFAPDCKVTLTTANGTYDGELLITGDLAIAAVFYFETEPTELKITKQPENASAARSEWVYPEVEAQGDDLTYQWWAKYPGDSTYTKLEGKTESVCGMSMSETTDGAKLQCVIKDKHGNTIKSNVVTITMVNPLVINVQPVDASAFEGENVSVTVEATGDDVTYQWYVKNPGASAYSKSSVTTNTYTTNMTEAKDGRILQCVIRDKHGNMLKSDVVTITMKKPVVITKQPVSTTVYSGDTAKVTVEAQGDGLTYQWWIKNPGDTAYSKSSITTNTYATNMTEAKDGRILRCVIKDQYGNLVRSDIVTINMKPATELKITKQPVSASVLKGDTVKVTVEAQGDGVTYQWWIKNPGDTAYSKSSITTNTYTTNMTAAKDGRILRCVIKDRYGNLVRSDIVTISMKAATELKITKQPVSASAEIGKYVSVSVEAEGDGLTYQWWIKNPGDSAYTKSSIKTATYTTKMAEDKDGRILRCVIKDKYGNLVRSDIVTINAK